MHTHSQGWDEEWSVGDDTVTRRHAGVLSDALMDAEVPWRWLGALSILPPVQAETGHLSITRGALIAAAVAVSFGVPVAAQTVQGIVIGEKSQTPIGNVRLSLVDDSGHVASTASSDATGTFFLDVPKAGRYQLKALIGRGGLSASAYFAVRSTAASSTRPAPVFFANSAA